MPMVTKRIKGSIGGAECASEWNDLKCGTPWDPSAGPNQSKGPLKARGQSRQALLPGEGSKKYGKIGHQCSLTRSSGGGGSCQSSILKWCWEGRPGT